MRVSSISNSTWVSLVHVVPKKGGVNMIKNDKNEHIPIRIVTRHRMCIDYQNDKNENNELIPTSIWL